MLKQTQKTNNKRVTHKSFFVKLFLPLALLSSGFSALVASARELPASPSPLAQNGSLDLAESNPIPLANGIYLYGQSAQPEQLGSAYMVFAVQQNRVVGAFYMPHSSFDCFRGSLSKNEMALTVIDSYEQKEHPFSVALEQTYPNTANLNNPGVATVGLQGFHKIDSISANDQRMLGVCQKDFQNSGEI